jgi:hypothetical protein
VVAIFVIAMIGAMPEATQEASPVSHGSASEPLLSRWIAPLALLIAVIAVALAVWALLRPPSVSNAPTPTAAQSADAKGRACAAYTTVRTAVSLQTHGDLGPEPVAQAAIAANARLAMSAGSSYLVANTDAGTPADLAAAMRSFAANLADISMNAQAGVRNDDPAQAARLHDGEAINAKIAGLCK